MAGSASHTTPSAVAPVPSWWQRGGMQMRAVALVLASALAAGGCAAGADATGQERSRAESTGVSDCAADVVHGPLPPWARSGFDPPGQDVTYALGESGDIVAVLFGYPLMAEPGPDRANKILWVGRVLGEGLADLVINATSDTGATMADTVSGGPGPSIIDVPSAGCWTFDLQWGGHRDAMTLPFDASGP